MQAEIIALRHQLTVVERRQRPKRMRLHDIDRCLWVGLDYIRITGRNTGMAQLAFRCIDE
jgi:hypothetical protein